MPHVRPALRPSATSVMVRGMTRRLTPQQRLQAWREQEGLSRDAAGRLLGASGSCLAHIEHGRRMPGRRLANALARVAAIAAIDWDAAEDVLAEADAAGGL